MNRSCRLSAWIGVAAIWLATCGMAWAASADAPIDEWRHTVWGAKDGAPRDIWAIAQTPDGWIWFGGPGGLYRFDGVSFERVETEPAGSTRSRAVSTLFALSSDALVVGYRNGGVAIVDDGKVVDYHQESGFDDVTVFEVSADAAGRIWAATRTGLLRFDGARWQRVGHAQGIPDGPVTAVRADGDGRVWVATARQILHVERGGAGFEAGPALDSPANFLQAPDGRLWYETIDAVRPCPLQHENGADPAPPSTKSSAVSSASTFDRAGGLWFTASTSVMRVAAAASSPAGLPDHFRQTGAQASGIAMPGLARTLFTDREGTVWIATVDGEIHQFRQKPVSQVSFPRHILIRGALEATPDGAVWAASRSTYYGPTDGDGLWRIDGDPVHVQPADIRSSTVAFAARDGALSVAGDGWLWRRRDGVFVHDIALPASVRANPVIAIADDPASESTWVSILGAGLFRRRGESWERNGGMAELPASAPTALAGDAEGSLWIGYADGRVVALRGPAAARRLQVLDTRVGAVRVISAGPRLLVGGDRGLAILQDGKLRELTTDEPAAFEVLTGLVQTPDGDAWLNGEDGAVRIRAAEFERVLQAHTASVAVRTYDTADGYAGHGASTLPYGNSMALGADGRIWFCGGSVPAWLDPAALPPDSDAGPLVLRSVTTAAGRVEARGPLHLAAGTRDLQLDYTTLDYTHPDRERFRYRLVGFDDRWTSALSRRQAFFTHVGPGHYRFEVQARNGTQDWSAEPATLEIEIPPTFTESRAFVVLCATAVVLGLALMLHARDEQLRRQEHAKLDERLAERERIARELHDTLLQSAQGLALKVQAATSRIAPGAPPREMLEQALKEADTLVIEGRDRIQDLRLDASRPDRLAFSLGMLGRERAQQQGVAFELAVDGAARRLRPAFADEAHRIGAEALLNAFRHAKARPHRGRADLRAAGISPARARRRRRHGRRGAAARLRRRPLGIARHARAGAARAGAADALERSGRRHRDRTDRRGLQGVRGLGRGRVVALAATSRHGRAGCLREAGRPPSSAGGRRGVEAEESVHESTDVLAGVPRGMPDGPARRRAAPLLGRRRGRHGGNARDDGDAVLRCPIERL